MKTDLAKTRLIGADIIRNPPPNVSTPRYDRGSITPGIVHIGVGNFHRAHQATYLDSLFNAGFDHDWGIIGAGILEKDAQMRKTLLAQDCLSTVVELDPMRYHAFICGSIIDYAPVDPAAIIQRLVRPEIRIVTLTITEGGYYMGARNAAHHDATHGNATHGNAAHGNVTHPDLVHDLAHPDAPRSVFGLILAALQQRRDLGYQPFSVVSCDNLPENGTITREIIMGLAEGGRAGLSSWIASEIAFPNSMVDCITPTTGDHERALVQREFGIVDAAPVVCEPFRQWVLEDRFCNGRPALEHVGVEFVDDVASYELMKLHILNGGHAAMAYGAALLGHDFVHDAMRDPVIRGFLERLEHREIIPALMPSTVGVDVHAYLDKVLARFSNPMIKDTVRRLCQDGSDRQPKFILPSLAWRLRAGLSINGLALVIALWCRYCMGRQENGQTITIEDEHATRLASAANRAASEPQAFLLLDDIFGPIGTHPDMVYAFTRALERLARDGTASTLADYAN